MSNQIVRRRSRNYPIYQYGSRALWNTSVLARNILRKAMRRRLEQIARNAGTRLREVYRQRRARKRIQDFNRKNYTATLRGRKKFYEVRGSASGPTHTTTRMIVRKTPRKQKFLRKLFRTNPLSTKYVNRFGFAWMGAGAASKTIWYSICHLKFNNIVKYMQTRPVTPDQNMNATSTVVMERQKIGNSPDTFIYVGKCTFTYELYNPTNYNMIVWIYDLICKRDTPNGIFYNDANNDQNSAPEACMQKGSESMFDNANNPTWTVGDPTVENTNTYFNTIGMKPTDYHLFNTLWKVKGIKKIILPPTTGHIHTVVFNPKKKITQANLFYPHEFWSSTVKAGLGGLTQATLFGFQGQVAVENDQSTDNTTSIGTLPGKLLVSCVKKVNIWNSQLISQRIIQETDLKNSWTKPTIFTDLVEQDAEAT